MDKEKNDGTTKTLQYKDYNETSDSIEVWEAPSLDFLDNLYCIYWYRYEKDYENPNDAFGSKHWKRIDKWFT